MRVPLSSDTPTYSFVKSFELPSQKTVGPSTLTPAVGPIAIQTAQDAPQRVHRSAPTGVAPRYLVESPAPDGLRAPPRV